MSRLSLVSCADKHDTGRLKRETCHCVIKDKRGASFPNYVYFGLLLSWNPLDPQQGASDDNSRGAAEVIRLLVGLP